jgi:hypothetical protein
MLWFFRATFLLPGGRRSVSRVTQFDQNELLRRIVTFQLIELALISKRILGTQRLFRFVTSGKANGRVSPNPLPAEDTPTAPDIADSIDWLIESSRPRGC